MSIALVTEGGAVSPSSVSSISVATTRTIDPGSSVVIAIWQQATGITPTSISDGTANAYVGVPGNFGLADGAGRSTLFVYCCASTVHRISNGNTVSWASDTSAPASIAYAAFSGAALLDVTVSANGANQPISLASGALASAAEGVVGIASQNFASGSSTGAWGTSPGFTNATSQINAPTSAPQSTLGIDYKIVASNSSVTFAPFLNRGSAWAAVVVSFMQPPPATGTIATHTTVAGKGKGLLPAIGTIATHTAVAGKGLALAAAKGAITTHTVIAGLPAGNALGGFAITTHTAVAGHGQTATLAAGHITTHTTVAGKGILGGQAVGAIAVHVTPVGRSQALAHSSFAIPVRVRPLGASAVTARASFAIGLSTDVEGAGLSCWDWRQTVISQYANSPSTLRLILDLAINLNQNTNFQQFYDLVWNVDTAVGWGLDVWGRIVGVDRVLKISSEDYFSFEQANNQGTGEPFGGGPFFSGETATANFNLSDDAYRQLIMAKAAANICDGSIPAINQILMGLFPDLGNSYVTDNGNMTMTYTFGFPLNQVQYAIITESGVLPKPVGVATSIVQYYNGANLVSDFSTGFYYGASGSVNSFLLLPGASFTRASPKYSSTSTGLLVPFSAGVPAVTNLGISIEHSVTNLLLSSQDFTKAAWAAAGGTTITPAAGVAPDGTVTAQLVTNTGGDPNDAVAQGIAGVLTGASQTVSLYMKAGGSSNSALGIYDATVPGWVVLGEIAWSPGGAATTSIGTGTGTIQATNVGNGWYRFQVTGAGTTGHGAYIYVYPDNTAAHNGSVYVWGAQLENTPWASSYIPTGTTTNLLLWSQDFTVGTTWASTNVSVTSNAGIAPDGTNTLQLLGTAPGFNAIAQLIAGLSNGQFTLSFYVKAGSSPLIYFQLYDSTATATIAGAAITWAAGAPTLSSTVGMVSIVPVGGGLYRVSATGTVVAAHVNYVYFYPDYSRAGLATYFWGVQVEAGSAATGYVPTTTAPVTLTLTGQRAFDNVNMALPGGLPKTVLVTFTLPVGPAQSGIVTWWDGAGSQNFVVLDYTGSGLALFVYVGAVLQADLFLGAVAPGTHCKVAARLMVGDVAASLNGGPVVTGAAPALPVVNVAYIGWDPVLTGAFFDGPGLASVTHYPSALPNAELQAMTGPATPPPQVIYLTDSGTLTRPADWNDANNSIECLAAGANGTASYSLSGDGGGYSKITNYTFVGSQSYSTGTAGGDSWFGAGNFAAAAVGARGGTYGSANQIAGGIGTVKYHGGSGAALGPGGAAGPNGNGLDGPSTPAGLNGGAADAGLGGAGGVGHYPSAPGLPGSRGTEWDSLHGSGGGGGVGNPTGGAGGLYGGGGAAGATTGGLGAPGIIRITYQPL